MTHSFALVIIFLLPVISAQGALILHYDFNESAGDAFDLSGMAPAANGSFNLAATRTTSTPFGSEGFALDTNGGVNSWVSTPDIDKLDTLASLTITGWINPQSTIGSFDRFVGDVNSGGQGYELLFGNNATTLQFVLGGASSTAVTSNAVSFNLNEWRFFALTWDGTNTSFFLGSEADSVTLLSTHTQTAAATLSNTTSFRVGGSERSASERTPDAFFDDIRVYNEALNLATLESVRLSVVPEPATYMFFGGMILLVVSMWRRLKS